MAVDIDKVLEQLNPNTSKKQKEINKTHNKIHKGYSGSTEFKEGMSYDAFEEEVAKYVKHHMKEHLGADNVSDHMARSKARDMYASIAGEDLRAAYARAKDEEGDFDEVLRNLKEGFKREERTNYISDLLHREIGENHGRRKELAKGVKKHFGDGIIPSDLSDDILASKYQQVASLYSSINPQIKDQAGKQLYGDGGRR